MPHVKNRDSFDFFRLLYYFDDIFFTLRQREFMENSLLPLATLIVPVFVGVVLFILSHYVGFPAIVFLLAGGILLGPEFLHVIDPSSLGDGLHLIISLSVAIILFEGGLTLNPEGLKKAPRMIWRMLTIGVLITWLGITLLIWLLLGYSFKIALLAGSLVIVTGPTVIAPLLKRIRVKEKLFQILNWEGVLVDPIGVFIAVLCFEWISIDSSMVSHFSLLGLRLLTGLLFGGAIGALVAWLLKKELVPEEQTNIFVFGSALLLFGLSETVVHEAGILGVVIAGLVIGWIAPPRLKHIRQFKSELTELAIAMVFILLAANLKLEQFTMLGTMGLWTLAGILFLVRPLSIFVCSVGTTLNINEKVFLSWIAPRGIVAGSMASLFGLRLHQAGYAEAHFLEIFTFAVIITTVLLQGLTAGGLARLLNVRAPDKKNWLIIGAHQLARQVADFIHDHSDAHCMLIDTNADAVREARQAGYRVYEKNALAPDALPDGIAHSVGHILALTDNRDLNQLICEKWLDAVSRKHLYRWTSLTPNGEPTTTGAGIPVWRNLPKPSQVSFGMARHELALRSDPRPPGPDDDVLMAVDGDGRFYFNDFKKIREKAVHWLVLETRTISLRTILTPASGYSLESGTYMDALSEMLDVLKERQPAFPVDAIREEIIKRETTFPTYIGNGVASPHVYSADIREPVCMIARSQQGIAMSTYDKKKVVLLFLLISPENKARMHLRLLGEMARIAAAEDNVKRILAVESPSAMVDEVNEILLLT
ncbi:MAG: hypothetical protein D6677_08555 [Calditrichaeota bacterium]|nr:MAG: hypothetical protein D6677_08555 [Calditrichota bacterium]